MSFSRKVDLKSTHSTVVKHFILCYKKVYVNLILKDSYIHVIKIIVNEKQSVTLIVLEKNSSEVLNLGKIS